MVILPLCVMSHVLEKILDMIYFELLQYYNRNFECSYHFMKELKEN